MKRSCHILLLVILVATTGGCTHVRPWDRDHLADYTMRPDRDPLTSAVNEHMWFSREATYGGRGVGGGGCGCN
jgi:hypothetical protein